MQESTSQAGDNLSNEQAASNQQTAGQSLEERVAALEAEVARIKAELRTATLQATSYRPDNALLPGSGV